MLARLRIRSLPFHQVRFGVNSTQSTFNGLQLLNIQPRAVATAHFQEHSVCRSARVRNVNKIPQQIPQRRSVHSSNRRISTVSESPDILHVEQRQAPLSILPLSMVLRSLATNIVCSSPALMSLSLRLMATLASSKNPILDPDRNPILRYVLKHTFYSQFCAGESATEVRRTVERLKDIGFTGVILGYAKEVAASNDPVTKGSIHQTDFDTTKSDDQDVLSWVSGTLETIRLADAGDCVAVKFTGAGNLAFRLLAERLPATPALAQAIDSICQLAQERDIRLLFDAEKDMLQDGIDDWVMHLARKYNTSAQRPVVYNTYQSYRTCAPAVLSRHLAEARAENFTLGVKLVRGAYLNSDPREKFHGTKAETDTCFDGIAESILTGKWSDVVQGSGKYPDVHLVLATHNAESIRHARAICDAGRAKSSVSFAQLQGMADEVSCELVEANASFPRTGSLSSFAVYKHLAWGTTGECIAYLLRRAQENKDAIQRTRRCRDAMLSELARRCKVAAGSTKY